MFRRKKQRMGCWYKETEERVIGKMREKMRAGRNE